MAVLSNIEDPEILKIDESPEIKELKKRIERLKFVDDKTAKVLPTELTEALKSAEDDLTKAQEVEAGIKATQTSADRIEVLRKTLKNLSAENDRIEKFLFLHDQYNKNLALMTEGPINEMFDYMRFRMFTTQVNGAIVPCCDILNVDMTPYETAMSTGEQMRTGIDGVKIFQNHFQISAPVFIDHVESLTTPIKLDCQTIELKASKNHSTLTKEI